jgi:uncharacterized membrane protein
MTVKGKPMQTIFSIGFLKVWLSSLVIFTTLDLLWLAVAASKLYLKQLGYLGTIVDGKIQFNLPIGLFTQAIIATAFAVIIVLATATDRTLGMSLAVGAFLGFAMYVTYDLTSLSFVRNWPLQITIIDIAWGTLQGLMAGGYVYYLAKLWIP